MAWHQMSWMARFQSMGDMAEDVFEKVLPFGSSERLGWRRPSVTMRNMNSTLRHMPDFYTESGRLVEVVGCGKDKMLKLKKSKFEALAHWHDLQPVALFVFNSYLSEWVAVEWDALRRLVDRARVRGIKQFRDGNEYFPIPWQDLADMASKRGEYGEEA